MAHDVVVDMIFKGIIPPFQSCFSLEFDISSVGDETTDQ